jgi:hypothetical protein
LAWKSTRKGYGYREIGAQNGSKTILKITVYKTMSTADHLIIIALWPVWAEQIKDMIGNRTSPVLDHCPQCDLERKERV